MILAGKKSLSLKLATFHFNGHLLLVKCLELQAISSVLLIITGFMVIAVAKVDGMTFKFGLGGGIDFYVGGCPRQCFVEWT